MPSETRRWVGTPASAAPSKLMAPEAWRSSPMIVRISVVLPAPLRPMRPANWPAPTSMLTPRRIPTGPIETETASSRNMRRLPDHVAAHLFGVQHLAGLPVGDDLAVVKSDHARGIARHDLHVVLDEQHRYALPAHRAHDDIHDAELLFG